MGAVAGSAFWRRTRAAPGGREVLCSNGLQKSPSRRVHRPEAFGDRLEEAPVLFESGTIFVCQRFCDDGERVRSEDFHPSNKYPVDGYGLRFDSER